VQLHYEVPESEVPHVDSSVVAAGHYLVKAGHLKHFQDVVCVLPVVFTPDFACGHPLRLFLAR